MLGSILVGLDRCSHADVLTTLGIRWARRSGATLVGLGIVDEPGIRAIEPAWAVGGNQARDPVYYRGYEGRMADIGGQVHEMLEQFAARCGAEGVAHEEVKLVGAPFELIEEQVQSCDMILLARCSHFRFTTRDSDRDETFEKVSKKSPRPLVVVPGDECPPEGPVSVAYDGSLQSARALAAFQATGVGVSGQVHIISVNSSLSEATRHAEQARKFLGYHQIQAVPVALGVSGDPAKVILEQVDRLGATLLVMGAYGDSAMRELFMGSVTQTVLKESRVPVFCYH